jgi:hypothetical protein
MSMPKTVASLRKSSVERVDESCNSLFESESSTSGVGKPTMPFLAAHVRAGAIYSASESGASSYSRDSFSVQTRLFRRLLRHNVRIAPKQLLRFAREPRDSDQSVYLFGGAVRLVVLDKLMLCDMESAGSSPPSSALQRQHLSLRLAPSLPGCGSGQTLDVANQPAETTMNSASQEEQRSLTFHLINDALPLPREQKLLINLLIAPDPEPQLVTRAQRPIDMALGVPALMTLPEQLLAPEMQRPRRQQPLLQHPPAPAQRARWPIHARSPRLQPRPQYQRPGERERGGGVAQGWRMEARAAGVQEPLFGVFGGGRGEG